MDDGDLWVALLVTVVLIILNGMLSSSEIAMMGLNEAKLRQKADKGDKKAATLLKMKQNPSGFLSTIQIGITLAGLLSGAFAADTFAQPLIAIIVGMGVSGTLLTVLRGVITFAITLLMTYFMLVFGELVPKRLAMQRPEQVASTVIGLIRVLSIITKPLVGLLSASTNAVLRLIGIDINQLEAPVTEEDVMLMMHQGREQGAIEDTEVEFLSNVFEFSDQLVEDAMTHRTEIETLPIDATLEDIAALMSKTGFNKFPIIEGNVDNIVGMVYSKDIISLYNSGDDALHNAKSIMRSPYFVQERKPLVQLFSEMKQNGERIAVVVDEYGGTSGIITLMDIIEEIIGDIEVTNGAAEQSDGSWLLEGMLDMDDVAKLLSLDLDDVECVTLNGFIVDQLGYIPKADERPSITAGGWSFTVDGMEGVKIARVRALKVQEIDCEAASI